MSTSPLAHLGAVEREMIRALIACPELANYAEIRECFRLFTGEAAAAVASIGQAWGVDLGIAISIQPITRQGLAELSLYAEAWAPTDARACIYGNAAKLQMRDLTRRS